MLRLALVPLVALVDASVLRGQSGRHLQNSDAGATPLAVTPPRSPAPSSIYGKIYVGVPPQEFLVVYDTGSGNMFLPDRACQSTSCMTKHSYDKLLSKAAKQVPNATSVPEEYPFDGVVGLGMPGLSRNKEYNFLGNLAEAQALEKDRFSVWLSKEVDHEDSEIAFGDIPMTRVGSEIAWFPLSSTEGLWQVEMKDLTVNLVRQGLCKGFTCHVAFDTGTGVLAGPRHMVEALKQELNVASDCSNWDGLPALGVELADGVFNIEKYEYVQKSNEGCFLQMVALDTVKPVLFLGTPFLERYITIYDRAFLRVGLAFAVHRSEATGESNEEARQRLMAREALGET